MTVSDPRAGEAMCPYRLVLEHMTSRWGVLVLIELLDRPHRFSELRRAVGRVGRSVSEKMLTQTLQTLERDGLVHRDAKPVIPPRVDYSLTPLGREAAERVRGLAEWTRERMTDVERARRAYDETRAAQQETRAAQQEARALSSRAS
ncbi:winged helix-turn-helix transcriptional regulator [Streptomyces flaveolus]|uniref:winged helix-turn-helix transcriptional regulator n=1 Tax=Streptomyces flaveolus TaxID=67297 RepID=UPI0016702D96|nr:helix-turn-helix domain-containing protein [Streptomyces flaveolus]GGQ92759.1 transcriptional regulator [Streptomyces flaveolus]